MANIAPRPSPFFDAGPLTTADSLAILHLKRDQLVPVLLTSSTNQGTGYAEGAVTNTRFGSFPHSTILGVPWGSQIRASQVDTGSRGRKGQKAKKEHAATADAGGNAVEDGRGTKRKREDGEGEDSAAPKAAITAGTGFVHVLPPTPESWTVSLPHRTQVVYTPDYSYVLQRLGVRPGHTIIEAGAGSGSFTHAAARAVFSGQSSASQDETRLGKVCSFEYHEPRAEGLRTELAQHGLQDIVHVNHRDVYQDGFLLDAAQAQSPMANAVFLDLPMPWLALRHLTRQKLSPRIEKKVSDPLGTDSAGPDTPATSLDAANDTTQESSPTFTSALDPTTSTHLCTFSPCIEQVQATVAALRKLGWTEIEMVEVLHKRIDVRRERIGLHEEGLRGVNATAATVEEALGRLREVEGRFKDWHTRNGGDDDGDDDNNKKAVDGKPNGAGTKPRMANAPTELRRDRLDRIKQEFEQRKIFDEGNLVHRTEPELKTHTSYLVFAVLPREWTDEDEQRCLQEWGTGPDVKGDEAGVKSRGAKASKKAKRGQA